VFVGKWHSRAGVMTLAEWMVFRFGSGRQGRIARHLSTVSVLLGTVGVIGYFFVGTGKFLSIFLPFSAFQCALLMIVIALFYTTMSGLFGVVYTDLLQAVLIGFVTLYISIKAFLLLDHQAIQEIAPIGWTDIVPTWYVDMPPGYEMYNLFGLSILFMFVKTAIEGLGSPGGYMAQRFFAVKNDRDSGLLAALWILLLSFRWPFIIGTALLGLSLGTQVAEPEMVLPTVLVVMIPIGLKGLIIAALIAAAMSTFDSTINAAASYIVNDIYLSARPHATRKQTMRASYVASVLIAALGVLIGAVTPTINAIWSWITMSLVSGMIMPNFLRWYWWRFNGYGYASGIAVGLLAAIIKQTLFPSLYEWQSFLIVSLLSLTGMIIGTLLTHPTDEQCLTRFYIKTRPIGFWRAISKNLDPDLVKSIKAENRRDIIALLFAVPWQISLFLVPTFAVLHEWDTVLIFAIVFSVSTVGLYFFWFRFLSNKNHRMTRQQT